MALMTSAKGHCATQSNSHASKELYELFKPDEACRLFAIFRHR